MIWARFGFAKNCHTCIFTLQHVLIPVVAAPAEGIYAENPDPADGAVGVADNQILHWDAGSAAACHDVYFGTDLQKLENAKRPDGDADGDGMVGYGDLQIITDRWLRGTPQQGSLPSGDLNGDHIVNADDFALLAGNWQNTPNPVFKGNQTGNLYDPGLLNDLQTYYWRIDEANYVYPDSPWKGGVWSFTVFDNSGLPEWAKKGYGVWLSNAMNRVFPDSRPQDWPSHPRIEISAARREYESFQIVVLPAPGRTVDNLQLQISDLTKGNDIISAQNIEWYQVGFVYLTDAYLASKDNYIDDAAPDNGWWPDILIPVDSIDIDDNFAQPIWLTVYVPQTTPPGEYNGSITISTENGLPAQIDLTLTVYNFTLAKGPGNCRTAFTFPSGSWNNYRRAADFALEHRLNVDYLSRTTAPSVYDLEHYYNKGQNSYTLMCTGNSNCLVDPDFIATVDSFFASLSHSWYQDELRDMAMFYGFDEANSGLWDEMADCFGILEDNFPDIERMTTAPMNLSIHWWLFNNPVKVLADHNIDYICLQTRWYDYNKAAALRTAGYQHWAYVCAAEFNSQYANFFIQYPLIESRAIWWQNFHQNMDGFLYWNMTNWKAGYTPLDPDAGPLYYWQFEPGPYDDWPPGDGLLIYPGKNDRPFASIRLANIRDGIEDYEYLWMLAQKIGLENARNQCAPVTWGLHGTSPPYTHDHTVVETTRHNIAGMIEP